MSLVRRSLVSERIQTIPASGIRKFFDLLGSLEGVISLGVGEPDFVTPWTVREAGIDAIERGYTMYTSNYGLLELREEIARHLMRLYGVRYDPKTEILVTVGVSEGLDIALRAALDPGDIVLSPDPGYVSYLPCIVLAGGEAQSIPTRVEDEFKLRPDDLESAIATTGGRARGLLIGYPSNPTGAIMTRQDLTDIAAIAERHDLLVLADEIYDRLTYDTQHTCFAALPGMKERTVLLGGFSKAYAMTGWRIGYACGPAEIIEAMMKVHQYTILCAPIAGQMAALEALRNAEEDVVAMVEEYNQRRRVMVHGLNRMGLPCFEPRGAFYAFPDITSTGLTSEEFAERLLFEERVAVVPGNAFGPAGEGHVRCCYATSLPQIEEALERIDRFVTRVRS
jgi:aminotransferase